MNISGSTWAALLLGAVALGACGDSTGGSAAGSGGSAGEGGHDGEGGHGAMQTSSDATSSASGSTTGAGGSDAAPEAPVLDEVAAMHMALHLYWTNTTEDCDEVEGERMTPDEDFAVFFTVPGTVDNEADDEASDSAVTYTYRLRCRRGDVYSEYSNELSGSPD